jgi:hypothetical protein
MLSGRRRNECKAQWLKTQNIKINKWPWLSEENELLKQIVQRLGTKDWNDVTTEFNKVSTGHMRTRKQCKDHWLNYLNPEVNK